MNQSASRRDRHVADPPSSLSGWEAEASTLHITVAAFSTGEPLDLGQELTLTKAAVLYADRVTLVGPKVVLISYVDRFMRAGAADKNAVILEMTRVLPGGADALAGLDQLARQRGGAVGVYARQMRDRALADARRNIDSALAPLITQTRFSEFRQAIAADVLALDPLTIDERPARMAEIGQELAAMLAGAARNSGLLPPDAAPAARQEILDRFQERILALLASSTQSQPLFDDNTGRLAEGLAFFAQKLGASVVLPAEPALAGALIETVPSFPDAPMDEILDARRRLGIP